MKQDPDLPTGKRHEITTIADMILLYAKLPEDRAELMLKEVTEGVRASGVMHKLMAALGAEAEPKMPAVWTDSDNGEIKLNYTDKASGEKFGLTLKEGA